MGKMLSMHRVAYIMFIHMYNIFIIDTESYERSFLRGSAIIVIVSAVVRLFIETIQFVRKRLRYFLDWENWMELCLFIATIIFVSSGLQSGCLCPESWQWQLGALALFIAWLDMVLFLKKFPLTGIYVVMFVDIFYTFMRMILLSILFVVAFGLAFYMLFFRPVRVCIACSYIHYVTSFPCMVISTHCTVHVTMYTKFDFYLCRILVLRFHHLVVH